MAAGVGRRAWTAARPPGGSIIGMSSGAGHFPHRYLWAYGSAKAGIDMLCQYAAEELGHTGVRVNTVRPGIVDDELMSFITAGGPLLDDYLAEMPVSRLGTVEDIAAAVRFLAGPGVGLDHRGVAGRRRGPPPPPGRRLRAPLRREPRDGPSGPAAGPSRRRPASLAGRGHRSSLAQDRPAGSVRGACARGRPGASSGPKAMWGVSTAPEVPMTASHRVRTAAPGGPAGRSVAAAGLLPAWPSGRGPGRAPAGATGHVGTQPRRLTVPTALGHGYRHGAVPRRTRDVPGVDALGHVPPARRA